MVSATGIIFVALAVAAGVAAAVGQGAEVVAGLPVPWIAAMIAFVVQWVAFVPAYLKQTEHFYDLTGSLTYLAVVWFCVATTGVTDVRALFLAVLVSVWAGRLGTFLFRRVKKSGGDGRFDEIKPSFPRFLVAWTLQGLWVFLTLAAAIAAIATRTPAPLGLLDALGLVVWMTGFGIEIAADRQKSGFREEHPDGFIDTGLWAWSRHPNYFGEIVLWTGIAIIASSTLTGWQWVAWISPVFVYFLLTRVSGIPILEERADERWGGDDDYEAYKRSTPLLFPRPS